MEITADYRDEKPVGYDLNNFTIRDMTVCGRFLRMAGEGAMSMEETAGRIVMYLYENLIDGRTGERGCALVRLFKTQNYSLLGTELQSFARNMLGGSDPSPSMKCLTLLATVGEKTEWGSRRSSRGHQAIPLPNEEAVRQIPMIRNLIKQLGLDTSMVVNPDPKLLLDMEQRTYNVFHVPEALGSPHIPAQEEFVIPNGIRSVLGFGGILPSGDIFSVIMFLKVNITHEVAMLFKTLSLNVKVALLPFGRRCFPDAATMGEFNMESCLLEKDNPTDTNRQIIDSRIDALEQLLEVYEKSVLEQTDKLYAEIAERKRAEEAVQRSEEKFRLLFNAANDPILLLDDNNRFIDCNEATLMILGAALKKEVLWRHPAEVSPELQPDGQISSIKAEQIIRTAFECGSMKFEWVHRRMDGSDFIVEVSLTVIPMDGQKVQLVHWRDITERQQATEKIVRYTRELERANAELKTLHEVAQAISRTLDLDELLSEVLHALVKTEIFPFEIRGAIFLIEEGKMRLGSFVSLSESAVEPCREIHLGKCLCGQAVESQEIVISSDTCKDERYVLCHPVTEPHGRIIVPLEAVKKVVGLLSLYLHTGTEVSENLLRLLSSLGSQIGIAINNARLYQESMNFSLHDPLTGLANRRFMEIQLEKSFQAVRRYGQEMSVIMLDIDHFKVYNDTHGHPEGDRLLAKIAVILQKEMRTADYVFRYGGEEFLVLFPETGPVKACNAAERLRSAVEAEAGVTISLGVAAYHEEMPDKEQLISKADAALYRAKQNGRNRVELSD